MASSYCCTHAVGGAFQIRCPRTRVCSLSNVSTSFSGSSLALHSLMCTQWHKATRERLEQNRRMATASGLKHLSSPFGVAARRGPTPISASVVALCWSSDRSPSLENMGSEAELDTMMAHIHSTAGFLVKILEKIPNLGQGKTSFPPIWLRCWVTAIAFRWLFIVCSSRRP